MAALARPRQNGNGQSCQSWSIKMVSHGQAAWSVMVKQPGQSWSSSMVSCVCIFMSICCSALMSSFVANSPSTPRATDEGGNCFNHSFYKAKRHFRNRGHDGVNNGAGKENVGAWVRNPPTLLATVAGPPHPSLRTLYYRPMHSPRRCAPICSTRLSRSVRESALHS